MAKAQECHGFGSRLRRLIAGTAVAAVPLVGLVEPAQAAGLRVELRVLVVTAGDPSSQAIATELAREGVPHTVVDLAAAGRAVIDREFLVDAASGAARFQAVVLPNANPWGMSPAELTELAAFERRFGIRQVNAYVYPGTGTGATATYAGSLDGAAGTVTAAARASGFSALSGPLPIDDFDPAVSEVYGYLAQPAADLPAGEVVTPLITATATEGSGAIAWSYAHDGREELMISAAYNPSMQWYNTIAHGVVSWMTRGIHLGHHRSYFDVQVDDVFLPDSRWSVDGNCTPGDDCVDPAVSTPDIRMNAADVQRLVGWQRANGFKLDMVFNAGGSVAAKEAGGGTDPLTDALLAAKAEFPWVNHTYSHPFMGCIQIAPTVVGQSWRCATGPEEGPRQDPGIPSQESGGTYWASQEFLQQQVQANIDWARANALPNFDATELVTGEHSGLRTDPQQPVDNPFLAPALDATGIRHIASDASREDVRRAVGAARTVPRYPMNVYYNTATYLEQIDEYNWYYTSRANGGSGICEVDVRSTCISPLPAATDAQAQASFEGYLKPVEVRNALQKVLANDPRSFYAHQSNLAEDGLLYPVVEGVLGAYRTTHTGDAPLVQIPLRIQSDLILKHSEWRKNAPRVSAYLDDTGVHISGPADVYAPLTVPGGTPVHGVNLRGYGGKLSGWFRVPTADTVVATPTAFRGGYVSADSTVTVPGAATSVAARAGNASATLTWTAPVSTGGSPIREYRIRRYDGTSATVQATATVPATAVSFTATGLTNGRAYTFDVVAVNAVGAGEASVRSNAVTPATTPGAPVIGTAHSGVWGGSIVATATWSAPATNGGSPVTGYRVTAYRIGWYGEVLQTVVHPNLVPASSTSLTMPLPQVGTYRFRVQAVNAVGTSPYSGWSNAVTGW
ncbi:fibronectin type III domain protein [Kineococcus xinjiangensis]|uniref:Fibronectin type III domain protein n=1 Tax=Kineococcus xinjiangensis TaxID=512762 RepID=A0A2S6IE60_9ACTN|nr:fibronectin type III domain-containing protein [Kineococcus xinjiangensis]PPK92476.1 fibronectin type III domain protein [Kineococcus xinjiangensis]